MKAASDQQYLIAEIGNVKFGIPLSMVSNVGTLTELDADRLERESLYEWHGVHYPRWNISGVKHTAIAGDSVLLLETGSDRRAFACSPRLVSRKAERLLMIPEKLRRMHPAVCQAFFDDDELVHCIATGGAIG